MPSWRTRHRISGLAAGSSRAASSSTGLRGWAPTACRGGLVDPRDAAGEFRHAVAGPRNERERLDVFRADDREMPMIERRHPLERQALDQRDHRRIDRSERQPAVDLDKLSWRSLRSATIGPVSTAITSPVATRCCCPAPPRRRSLRNVRQGRSPGSVPALAKARGGATTVPATLARKSCSITSSRAAGTSSTKRWKSSRVAMTGVCQTRPVRHNALRSR